MSNKLKDIFSDNIPTFKANIKFENPESHSNFLKAIQIVQDEGRPVEVEGIASIHTEMDDDKTAYPFPEKKNISMFTVFPSVEEVPIILNTERGEKPLVFKRYQTTNEVVLETDPKDIIYFKLIFAKGTDRLTFTYRMQLRFAASIIDVIERYQIAIALLNSLSDGEGSSENNDDYALFNETRRTFQEYKEHFTKMNLLEKELGTSFEPAKLADEGKTVSDVDELYVLLIEKKPIRLNAKLTSTESTGIIAEVGAVTPKLGAIIDIVFSGKSECTICGQKISVYTANLLSHAVIKAIEDVEGGGKKLFYDDTDSAPMYISYTGFKTIDEAQEEMKTIMEHKEKYVDALTVAEHLKAMRE